MDRGTYAAASSGLANLRKLEAINNNLANINTAGFKRQMIVTDEQQFDQTLAKELATDDPYAKGDHQRTPGVTNIRSAIDFSPGAIKHTGNPLDVALRKQNQFFVIQTPEGEQYSRAGNFTLSSDGQIVTPEGFAVLGDGGAISTDGPGVNITSGGAVRGSGQEFGKLRVVEFTETSGLQQVGGNRFKVVGGAAPSQVDPDLEPTSLEMANVSAVTSIVEMISASRGFELYTRTAQTIDQLNQTAITQVGRAR